jgi:micrococcal nuclease
MRRKKLFLYALPLLAFLSNCETDRGLHHPALSEIPISPASSPFQSPPSDTVCIPANAPRQAAVVTALIDGDTIRVEMGGASFRVRYIGVDAPEMAGEPLAGESLAANRRLVEGKTVLMMRDLSEADRFGRLLRYVIADGVFVNRELVLLGMARAESRPPDTSCDAEFQAAEKRAREGKRGLWGMDLPTASGTPRGAGCAGGCTTPPAGCRIKGNINSKGEKIYHVPGGNFYEQTEIEPEKGERWFCTEEEAAAAGWRRSKR